MQNVIVLRNKTNVLIQKSSDICEEKNDFLFHMSIAWDQLCGVNVINVDDRFEVPEMLVEETKKRDNNRVCVEHVFLPVLPDKSKQFGYIDSLETA